MARAKNNYSLPLRLNDITAVSRSSPAHKGSLRHSLDFICEEETSVYAALGGLVVFAKDDSSVGGPKKEYWNKGNRIVIRHKNNEYSAYEHFRHKGTVVRAGERVRKGQLIGCSGNTGFSYCPHLHFEVFNNPNHDESEGETLQVFLSRLIEDALRE